MRRRITYVRNLDRLESQTEARSVGNLNSWGRMGIELRIPILGDYAVLADLGDKGLEGPWVVEC